MCGLVGLFDTRGQREIARELLVRLTDSLVHRGPDGSGLYVKSGIGLGHRRLAIIDRAGGQQPLFNEDHSVVVVYNGEIYNFQELARELITRGHRFRTHCDTEVIVHAWEEWGEASVERFRGMFAFALWDENRQTLFLARDRLGIKPLYYAMLDDGMLLFGSELKALLLHPLLRKTIDLSAVDDYFAYGYLPDPKSIYRDVAKLSPGHVLAVRRGQNWVAPRAYWDVSFRDRDSMVDEREICEELIARLREAVKMRLISEVPLGAFLSGGIDSSSVVALMAGLATDPPVTCSISFGDVDHDESHYARMVAERYSTRHHVHRVDPDSFDLVSSLANIYDEPFADSSAIPTYRVCSAARQHVTVALSGDGGDEVFAGYRRYRWHYYEELVRSRMPLTLRRPLFGLLGAVYPKMDWAPKPLRAKSTLEALSRTSEQGYFHSVSFVPDRLRYRLFNAATRRELGGYHPTEVLNRHFRNAPTDDHLSRIQYVDMKTYLPGDILTKVDRASMANSLEVRVPILDHPFVEWTASLSPELKLRRGQGKYIFKKALEGHLPETILYRPKMGFAVPLARWFRGPLRDRLRAIVSSAALRETGIFDSQVLSSMVDQHVSGARDHSVALWSVVMFEAFLRQVHQAKPAQSPLGADELAPQSASA